MYWLLQRLQQQPIYRQPNLSPTRHLPPTLHRLGRLKINHFNCYSYIEAPPHRHLLIQITTVNLPSTQPLHCLLKDPHRLSTLFHMKGKIPKSLRKDCCKRFTVTTTKIFHRCSIASTAWRSPNSIDNQTIQKKCSYAATTLFAQSYIRNKPRLRFCSPELLTNQIFPRGRLRCHLLPLLASSDRCCPCNCIP